MTTSSMKALLEVLHVRGFHDFLTLVTGGHLRKDRAKAWLQEQKEKKKVNDWGKGNQTGCEHYQ